MPKVGSLKHFRQGQILKLVTAGAVASQDDLKRLLAQQNMRVTQATLSRDLQELKLVKTPEGKRVLWALIDTTGYSSQIRQKYIGMLISETKLSVCSIVVGVGSYGFGLERPKPPSTADAKFNLYNQAGARVGTCPVKYDVSVQQPKPLAVTSPAEGPTKLYLGKYGLEIK